MDYRFDKAAADSALLILAMAEGSVPDSVMLSVRGGEVTRGYAALITAAAGRLAHTLGLDLAGVLPVIREAAARSAMDGSELASLADGLDLMAAVWADDREAVVAAVTSEKHTAAMASLASLCGFLFDLEAAGTNTTSAVVIEGYRALAVRALAG